MSWRAAIAEVLRAQVAEIDAAVIQVDEANLTGHAEDAGWAHEPINTVLGGVQGEKALHLCFGNYGGQTIQAGEWRALLGFLNALDVDHLVLEFARRGYDELELFNDLRPEIALGVGLVDIKDNAVESPGSDRPAHRTRRARAWGRTRPLGAPRLRLLDAPAQRRGPQAAGAGRRPRPLRGPLATEI